MSASPGPVMASVVWVLGSDSDLPHIADGVVALRELQIPTEVRILSAHRTPDAVDDLARHARARGVKVLIGVAGGAAHLPGVLAARTTLPVIGVPIPTDMAGGLDSLLSIVQMPAGIPVGTVAGQVGRAQCGAARGLHPGRRRRAHRGGARRVARGHGAEGARARPREGRATRRRLSRSEP